MQNIPNFKVMTISCDIPNKCT